jgi:hypothetical protein
MGWGGGAGPPPDLGQCALSSKLPLFESNGSLTGEASYLTAPSRLVRYTQKPSLCLCSAGEGSFSLGCFT